MRRLVDWLGSCSISTNHMPGFKADPAIIKYRAPDKKLWLLAAADCSFSRLSDFGRPVHRASPADFAHPYLSISSFVMLLGPSLDRDGAGL